MGTTRQPRVRPRGQPGGPIEMGNPQDIAVDYGSQGSGFGGPPPADFGSRGTGFGGVYGSVPGGPQPAGGGFFGMNRRRGFGSNGPGIGGYGGGYGPGGGGGGTTNGGQQNYPPPGVRELADSFWSGKTLAVPTSSGDYSGLRGDLQSYLRQNMGGIRAQRANAPAMLGAPQDFSMSFGQLPQFGRGDIRDVSSGNISDAGTNIQSVSDIGGANSPFLQNIMNQLQPVWDQQRSRALAQAKEAAGNLTGSGYGAHLARGLDRQMANERQELLGYATNAMNQELARQTNMAQLAQQRNLASPELQLRAALANQGADSDFINALLQRGGLQNVQDANRMNLGLANMENRRGYDLARFQGDIDRYGIDSNLNNADAQRFSSLFGQLGTAGVSPDELVQTGGAGAIIPALLGMLGQMGGPGGRGLNLGGVGDFLQNLFRGGGMDNQGDWGWLGDIGGIFKGDMPGGPTGYTGGSIPGGYRRMDPFYNPVPTPGGYQSPSGGFVPGGYNSNSITNRATNWFNKRLLRGRL